MLAVGSLDRENKDTYELVVKASDKGSPQREVRDSCRMERHDANNANTHLNCDEIMFY